MPEIRKLSLPFVVAIVVIQVLARLGMKYEPNYQGIIGHAVWVLSLCCLAWLGYRINYIRWKVKRENYLLCMNCLYSLKGLESPGKCPECGTPYSVEVLKKEWISNLKKAPF